MGRENIYKHNEKNLSFRMTIQKGVNCLVHPHWHDHIELIKILKGKAAVKIGQENFYGVQDDIIYINSRSIHSVYSIPGCEASIMGMVFDKFFLSNAVERPDTQYIYNLFVTSKNIMNHFKASHVLWKELNDCMTKAYSEFTNQDVLYEMPIKACVYRIVTSLIRYYKNEIIGHEQFIKLAHDFMILKPVLDFIDRHYAEKIYTKDLCRQVAMSPSHFTRYFKKVTGKTPTEYINEIRINASVQLLKDSGNSITKIAEITGFCNINYFDRVFKKKLGYTPREYRSKIRPKE